MSKVLFKIWCSNRKVKKSCIVEPKLEAVIRKGKLTQSSLILIKWKIYFYFIFPCLFYVTANDSLGLNGNRLVLENDGTEICDDETLEYFANDKQIFIMLNENEMWTHPLNENQKLSNVSGK